MTDGEIKAHGLAQTIMVVQAKEACAHQERRGRGGKANALPWHHFYDPAAATCLGNLIYQTMKGST